MGCRVLSVSVAGALTLPGDSLLYVVLPLYAPVLGLSGFQVGLLLSGNRFVRMVTNSGVSWFMRRFGPGVPFSAATVLTVLTTASYALTPAFLPFFVARLLLGLSFSTLRLGSTLDAAAGDLAPPHQRAQVMSAYADWSDIGAALGPFLALTFAGTLGLRPRMPWVRC